MRSILLVSIIAISLGATVTPEVTNGPALAGPCEMGSDDNASARSFVRGFLTDTGENGTTFARTRSQLGITGVSYSQVVVVQDTVKCRNAINAWKSLYATLSAEAGAEAAQFNTGMLFRITPNRFVLATPMLNKYSFLTYIALDSNWTVVRKNL
ncbi:MAG: hypothetical protein IBJ03_15230 [Gemmatimonadaceae bacterium]|nr:hypothetical protein [Gemmatimonadaceae bacterium]